MKLVKNQQIGKEVEKEIISIIENAKKNVVLVSPYININETKWEEMYKLLHKKSEEGLFIEVHARKNKNYNEPDLTESDITNLFNDIKLEKIYLHQNLHAKLFFNETKALVTTLNLLNSSRKNIEIGYLTENEQEYNELVKDFYYPELVKDNDDELIKERKLFLKNNFDKFAKNDIQTNDKNDELIIKNNNYEIAVIIKEELLEDTVFNIYYNIKILNDNYLLDKIPVNELYDNKELLFMNTEGKNITALFHEGFSIPITIKNLLTNYYFFISMNSTLFSIMEMLESNAKKQ